MPRRRIWVRLLVLLCVLISSFGLAASPARAMENYGPWRGEYFDNQDLGGTPKLVRTDAGIDFDWNLAAPDPAIPNEHFSVRWTAFIQFDAAVYRFTCVTDDGMRIWIDERPILDKWQTQPTTQYQVDVAMAAGYHYMRVEYFDSTDRAVAKFFWDRQGAAPPAASGWQGEYYNNPWLIGNPVMSISIGEKVLRGLAFRRIAFPRDGHARSILTRATIPSIRVPMTVCASGWITRLFWIAGLIRGLLPLR
jgi:hypothetical protein